MSWDLAQDAAVFDGSEQVALHFIEGGEAVETVIVSGALRGPLLRQAAEAAAAGAALAPSELLFHLPAAPLAGRQPRVGDAIRDAAGHEYTILEAVLTSRGTRWKCRCNQTRQAE
jgi:hypothetical protein